MPDQHDWVHGIDVSHWQGTIDWAAVSRGGIRYAWAKATDGSSGTDHSFPRNRAGAQDHAIQWGAYHFARPGDPVAQARRFVDRDITGGGLPPALDLEVAIPGAADFALAFLETVEELTGVQPIFYGNAAFVGADPRLARFPLWLPRYTAGYVLNPDPKRIKRAPAVGAWNAWSVWQFTSSGDVPGISTLVDRNVAVADWWHGLGPHPEIDDIEPTEEEDMAQALLYNEADDGTYLVQGLVAMHLRTAEDLDAAKFFGAEDRTRDEDGKLVDSGHLLRLCGTLEPAI